MYKWTLLIELLLEAFLDFLKSILEYIKEYNHKEEQKWFQIFYFGELWKHGMF